MLRLRFVPTRLTFRPALVQFQAPRFFAVTRQVAAKPLDQAVSPQLFDLLRRTGDSEADVNRYVRNMSVEELTAIMQTPEFAQHMTETKRAEQQAQPPMAQDPYRNADNERLGGGYPWADDDYYGGEEEGEGEGGSYGPWEDFGSQYSQDALREAHNTKFTETTDKPSAREKQMKREWLMGAMKQFRIGTVILPTELIERVALALKGYSRKQLAQDADQLSAVLRARTVQKVKTGDKIQRNEGENIEKANVDPYAKAMRQNITESTDVPPLAYDHRQVMAYIAHRLPGIYSCNYRALHEIKDRFPSFTPRSMVDFGSGPGTAIWAASELWTTIQKIKAIEPSYDMMEISKKLCAGYPVSRIQYLQPGNEEHDLVVSSYALSELADDQSRLAAIRTMWSNVTPGGFLILIEPGTPVGFQVIRSARTLLLDLHGLDHHNPPHIIAPCTHTNKCPMGNNTAPGAIQWCHFTQRVQRIQLQLASKKKSGATRNFENEKFSYIILSKGKPPEDVSGLGSFTEKKSKISQWSRLIRNPIKRGGHVIVDACDPYGAKRFMVSKRGSKQVYRSARKAMWGDAFSTGELRSDRDLQKINNPNYRPWYRKMLERKVGRGEITRAQMEDTLNHKRNRRAEEDRDERQYPHDLG